MTGQRQHYDVEILYLLGHRV